MMREYPIPAISAAHAVLDNAPVAVYVSAEGTRELLYANRLARKLIFSAPYQCGLTCYQAVGFSEPCPFCSTGRMNREGLLTRSFRHPVTRRLYQLSGMLIDWNGVPAHIEYVSDVTEIQAREDRTKALSEELQATFASIPCGLCVYRYDGEQISPLFHNPAFYEIMGYSEEHIRSVELETNFLGVHPEDVAALREKIEEVLRNNGVIQQVYRIWNDRRQEYRWIRLEGSAKSQEDGAKLLYGVYSDVTDQRRMEKELTDAGEKMQDIINSIPGGVAIFKVSSSFETVYFSDGVPELIGYTVEEYRRFVRQDAAKIIYREDVELVLEKVREIIESRRVSTFEFREQHRNGSVVWVRALIRWMGEEEGLPLLHCVFHNISDLKEAQLEMEHLVNSIPGGIASYRIEGERFIPTFCSEGVMQLSGHTKEEFDELVREDALNIVYEADRKRVLAAAKAAIVSGEALDISYRMRSKAGKLIWIHLNGRRMGPLAENMSFYAVFTGISAETQLFQSIANETADGIYVIDKESHDLLYANEAKTLFHADADCIGRKCYEALHGLTGPCEFCTLGSHAADGEPHEMIVRGTGRFYSTSFREADWNGIPAYVKYVKDVTESVRVNRERKRLEEYFQTVVKHLPGGVAVVRYEEDGTMTPEFLSEGFAAMTGMTIDEAWELYRKDAMSGVHPDDLARVRAQMDAYIGSGDSRCELVYRLQKGDGSYLWVKNTLSVIQSEVGETRVYAGYHDMTRERAEQEQLRQQYNELIMQHYRTPGPNALVIGHCNITKNRILEIIDHTHSDLLETFSSVREAFFTGIGSLVVDGAERRVFLDTYLNKPSLDAFARGETELTLPCFIKLPKERCGRYVRFKVNLVETPDTGDITGILTVTDITEQTISDRILHQLSLVSYDLLVDVDLLRDRCTILSGEMSAGDTEEEDIHSNRVAYMLREQVVPRDRELVNRMMDPAYMTGRLKQEGSYSFPYSIVGEKGDLLAKKLTVSAIDLRLGRVCLARADITDSVREQQGLLNVVAYTFELLAMIKINTGQLTLHTRKTVLESLSPFEVADYESSVERMAMFFETDDGQDVKTQFRLDTMLARLAEKPAGYDFVLPYRSEGVLRYKQINVLWGDEDHKTVCMVRADVTDMLTAERRTKCELERALALAEEANQAKTDFLSSMSHDIRTPMNAIMGMTALAAAHLNDRSRVEDCLQKISFSSKHLLSLINDILDMSKIERSKITLNRMAVFLPELVGQLSAMMAPQAESAGLAFDVQMERIHHSYFYGDSLRVNQILINILGNAIKFTPEGGRVAFQVEELPSRAAERLCYRFSVSDTGVGMSEEFLAHIFEPFTRNRNTTRVEGSGLGLSITKGLIDLMGGELFVESREHQGTTFRVELEFDPVQEGDRLAPKIEARASGSDMGSILSGRCFLVAEDNMINSEILCELLQMHGARSVVRTDGAQTVQAFQASAPGTFDAILMDIQMPEMNGYEATRVIRGMDRADAGSIPIIAMTANAFAEDIQASIEAGMTAHVAKPIDLQILGATLGSVLGRVGEG